MRLQEIGFAIRQARLARHLTQAELAHAAGLTRTTLNQLENGVVRDLGVRKLQAVLDELKLTLSVQSALAGRGPDPFKLACKTASVSYRNELTVDELIRGLLSGKVPAGRRRHFRTLLDEAPTSLLQALIRETGLWSKPGKVEKNLMRIAHDVGALRDIGTWLTTG